MKDRIRKKEAKCKLRKKEYKFYTEYGKQKKKKWVKFLMIDRHWWQNKALKENLKKAENSSYNKLKNKIKAFCWVVNMKCCKKKLQLSGKVNSTH